MRISLSSPNRRFTFLAICALFVVVLWALSWQALLEYWFSRSDTVEGLQRAARIQPLNAGTYEVLGAASLTGLEADFHRSISYFQKAAALNPHSARAWMGIAELHNILGNHDLEIQAAQNAFDLDPKDTQVAWKTANLFIANGETGRGLVLLRDVIQSDPDYTAQGMRTAFGATGGDVNKAIVAIPPNSVARLKFLHYLVDRQQPEAADQVWPMVVSASGQLHARDVFFYIDDLLSRHAVKQAYSVWTALATLDPEMSRPTDPANLVVNGDFESSILNGGFAWRYVKTQGVTMTMDTSTFHSGTRALAIDLDAENLTDAGLSQFVPLEPGAHYVFRGFLHAEDLESGSGPRLSIIDAYQGTSLLLSEPLLGAFPWREVSGEFVAGTNVSLAKIAIVRSPANGRVRGRLWLDDLRVEKR